MILKEIAVNDIISFLGKDVIETRGIVGTRFINNITNAERVNCDSFDWINPNKDNKQQIAEGSPARVLLTDKGVDYSCKLENQGKLLIVVDNPKLSLMRVISRFMTERFESGIHPTTFVHPEAEIGNDVYIGPHCYIGKCKIGDNNVIHSGVHIYDRSVIGDNNVIHSGAVICVDGLGCIRREDGTLEEFPQIGGVIIGDNCYIGANTHIASGSLSDTIIGNGCKINGMCFIGSNDILHDNIWITGSTMLAGSVEVGKNTNIFSRVVVRDWCKIGEGCTIGMGAVVTKNVPDGETWVGNPATKMGKKQ